jgi:hypothetical protein
MAASIPMIYLFFAMGFAARGGSAAKRQPAIRKNMLRGGAVIAGFAIVSFLAIPWLAHRLASAQTIADDRLVQTNGEAVISGGHRMVGFLVVPDGTQLRADVPSLQLSDFANILQTSGIESSYQTLLHPASPPLPFGFVFAPRLEKDAHSGTQFIVPAEVLERRDVPAWRLQITDWGKVTASLGYGPFWFYASRAEPIP